MPIRKGLENLDNKPQKLDLVAYPALDTLLGFNRRVARKIEEQERAKDEAKKEKPLAVQLVLEFERPPA